MFQEVWFLAIYQRPKRKGVLRQSSLIHYDIISGYKQRKQESDVANSRAASMWAEAKKWVSLTIQKSAADLIKPIEILSRLLGAV